MDNRSNKFIFVPFCLMAQAYQAQGIVKYEWKSCIRPFVDMLMDYNINIVQMPCAESEFKNNLIRKPMGITKYDNMEFNDHCENLANSVSKQIKNLISANYEVVAILGIEQSPSCCINYIYTNKGMEKRMGLFMQKLYEKIEDLNIPMIGINRKYINKSLKQLEEVLK